MMESKTRILVIGAGVAGLCAIKACKEENLMVVCYEKASEFGGLWRYHENGSPSIMKNTVSNTSKEMSAFSDFPPPSDTPTYLHHKYVMAYLESYADHFHLLNCVTFSQEVIDVVPDENYGANGKWLTKVRDLLSGDVREETYDGVMVCTGHHNYPLTPTYKNLDLYAGKTMHSSNYKTFQGLENETVLIVGAGNSGADIAVEASSVAKKVFLSTRRGAWLYPRMLGKGKPLDIVNNRRYRTMLPAKCLEKNLEKTLNKRMDHKRFGVKPCHSVLSQHPTINDEIQVKLLVGSVCLKPDVKEFVKDGVIFEGSDEVTPVSVVLFATGFQVKFPFISEDIIQVGKNNKVLLYENVFPPQLKHHTLGIIGLIQPNGSLFPVFEIQSRWFVALMTGNCSLPASEKRLQSVQNKEEFRARSYVQSARHSFEAHWIAYMDNIAEKIGAKPNFTSLFFKNPKLFKACVFGPCLPYQYRLSGKHKWDGAKNAILTYKKRMYEHLEKGKTIFM